MPKSCCCKRFFQWILLKSKYYGTYFIVFNMIYNIGYFSHILWKGYDKDLYFSRNVKLYCNMKIKCYGVIKSKTSSNNNNKSSSIYLLPIFTLKPLITILLGFAFKMGTLRSCRWTVLSVLQWFSRHTLNVKFEILHP